jgi:hypothetical protein
MLRNILWHDEETNVRNEINISFSLNKIINYLFCYHKTKCHLRFTNIVNNNLAGDPFHTPALSEIRTSDPNCLLVLLLKHRPLTFQGA